MNVEVCTVFAPRDGLEWKPYLPLLALQRRSALAHGHRHVVVTDDEGLDSCGFQTSYAPLATNLMQAMLDGVIHRLRAGGDAHIVFVDADCLILRDLTDVFPFQDSPAPWDLALTRRDNDAAPINNGAMYVHRDGISAALRFFEQARAICAEHWGGDQEAISQAAAPVPDESGPVEMRQGCRVAFLSMKQYNAIPKVRGRFHHSRPFVLHFKGAEAKDWMAEYAQRYLFPDERAA